MRNITSIPLAVRLSWLENTYVRQRFWWAVLTLKWIRLIYTVFQKKTPTHIVGYKLRSSCLILIIVDIEIPDII